MAREFLLGLDAGGGAGRCLLIDLNSAAVITAQRRWRPTRSARAAPCCAADMAENIERSAAIILGCYALGKPPPALPDATVELLRRTGELIA